MTDLKIAYPDGAQSARISPWQVSALVGGGADPSVLLGWVPDAPPWLDDERLHGVTAMGGYALTGVIATGRVDYLPVRLGGVPALLEGVSRPDVVVVGAVRRGERFAYNGAVGWAPAAVRAARIVVVEVAEDAVDLGAPIIDAWIDHVVTRDASYEPVPISRSLDALDLVVGRAVVSVFPDEPTLQLGPGGIAEAIVQSIDRPVGLRSGLITEAMAELDGRGLLRGIAVGGYTWGSDAIVSLAAAGRLDLQPVEVTHDVGTIAGTPQMVSCNTAVQLGLDGSVNVERVGGRLVAGIGGHSDFCAGARGARPDCRSSHCARRAGAASRRSCHASMSSPPSAAMSTWSSPSTVWPTCAASATQCGPPGSSRWPRRFIATRWPHQPPVRYGSGCRRCLRCSVRRTAHRSSSRGSRRSCHRAADRPTRHEPPSGASPTRGRTTGRHRSR